MADERPTAESIGDYSVTHELEAARGLGRAYVAMSRSTPGSRQQFLVKRLVLKGIDRSNAEREIQRVGALKHPAIAPVVGSFEHGGDLAVVFEYVDGLWLEQIQIHLEQAQERLSDKAIGHIAHQLMGALGEAHAAKDEAGRRLHLIHGELGPDRIHISWDGTVRIYGVGVAAVFADADRSAFALSFRAPEQLKGQANVPQSDLYSASAVLWSLLTGRRPNAEGEKLQPLTELRTDLPRRLGAALNRALDHSAARRTITCSELSQLVKDEIEGAADPRELRWNMELFKALSLFSTQQWPPPRRRNVPAAPLSSPIVDDESSIDWTEPSPPKELKPAPSTTDASAPVDRVAAPGSGRAGQASVPAAKRRPKGRRPRSASAKAERAAPRKPPAIPAGGGPRAGSRAAAARPAPRVTLAQASFSRGSPKDLRRQAFTVPIAPSDDELEEDARVVKAERIAAAVESKPASFRTPPSVPRPELPAPDSEPAPTLPKRRATPAKPTRTKQVAPKPTAPALPRAPLARAGRPTRRRPRASDALDGAEDEVASRLAAIAVDAEQEPSHQRPAITPTEPKLAEAEREETPVTPITVPQADVPAEQAKKEDVELAKAPAAPLEAAADEDAVDRDEPARPRLEPPPAPRRPTPKPAAPAAAAKKLPATKTPADLATTAKPTTKRRIRPALAIVGIALASAVGMGVAWTLGLGGLGEPPGADGRSDPTTAPTAPTATQVATPPPTASVGPAPTTGPDAAIRSGEDAAAPTAAPTVAADGLPPVVDELGGDGSELLSYEGYLIVRSKVQAEVVVQGIVRGPTNTKLKSRCRQKFIRLRDPSTGKWLTAGQGLRIACMSTTTVTINP